MKGLLLCIALVLACMDVQAQSLQILDAQTRLPIPYAKLYSKQTQSGFVANYEGKFDQPEFHPQDSIRVFAATYQDVWIVWKNAKSTLYLEPKIQYLDEVSVSPENSEWYNLLSASISMNKKHLVPSQAKAFLDVESFRNGRQVELFQAYYNADMKGYDLTDLKIKSGRYYFSPDSSSLFTSSNLSRAFCMNPIFAENEFFPGSPFTLNKRQLRKEYRLSFGGKYVAENGHTILKINFTPRENLGRQFKGSITLDSNTLAFYQLNYDIQDARVFPYERIQRRQTSHMSMNIQKFFRPVGNGTVLESIQYTNQMIFENPNRPADTILSKSLLSLFERMNSFLLPDFNFLSADYHGDLRNTLLLQHTLPFWSCYSSFQKSASQKYFIENCEVLLDQNGTYNVYNPFSGQTIQSRRILESPYQIWSPDYRVRIRERQKNQRESIPVAASTIPSTQYDLTVQLLLDFNYDCDNKLFWTTKTVFDPFSSFYNFELTPQALAYINIYFDLAEIHRRLLEQLIAQSDQSIPTIRAIHAEAEKSLETFKKEYSHKVERGNNLQELKRYNDLVKEKLGIDNLEHFGIQIAD